MSANWDNPQLILALLLVLWLTGACLVRCWLAMEYADWIEQVYLRSEAEPPMQAATRQASAHGRCDMPMIYRKRKRWWEVLRAADAD